MLAYAAYALALSMPLGSVVAPLFAAAVLTMLTGSTGFVTRAVLQRAHFQPCSKLQDARRLWRNLRPATKARPDPGRSGGLLIVRGLLRLTAFAVGLSVAFPTMAQTIGGSS